MIPLIFTVASTSACCKSKAGTAPACDDITAAIRLPAAVVTVDSFTPAAGFLFVASHSVSVRERGARQVPLLRDLVQRGGRRRRLPGRTP
jgi:CRISPR/Cas system endoribonuclease Cas6 (RAMP superfamily)